MMEKDFNSIIMERIRMQAEARRLEIIDILSESDKGIVSIRELSRRLGVSEMTIRRDLDWLAERSILNRVHGGAIAYQSGQEKPFLDRAGQANPQKIAVGWTAAHLVKEGDKILLDAGTTTQQVARHLIEKSNLTVITNNLYVAAELAPYPAIETIVLGGSVKHQENCTIGPITKQELAIFSVDKYFLSASGFSIRQGITDHDLREVEIKQAMMRAAAEIILVADSSKWNAVNLVRICRLQDIHALVTDDELPQQAIGELENEGIVVYTPERLASQIVRSSYQKREES